MKMSNGLMKRQNIAHIDCRQQVVNPTALLGRQCLAGESPRRSGPSYEVLRFIRSHNDVDDSNVYRLGFGRFNWDLEARNWSLWS